MTTLALGKHVASPPARTAYPHRALQTTLLASGILSSLLYVAATIVGAALWQGRYSAVSQAISELSAVGAPSRPVMVVLNVAYALLAIAFGVGVRRAAGRNRALRITGLVLVVYGATCLLGPAVPMHMRGAATSATDTLHIVMTAVDVGLILLALGFGGRALGRRFRWYSTATALVVLAFGAWTGVYGPNIAKDLPTPWMGVLERVCIFTFLLWVAVLSVVVMGATRRGGEAEIG